MRTDSTLRHQFHKIHVFYFCIHYSCRHYQLSTVYVFNCTRTHEISIFSVSVILYRKWIPFHSESHVMIFRKLIYGTYTCQQQQARNHMPIERYLYTHIHVRTLILTNENDTQFSGRVTWTLILSIKYNIVRNPFQEWRLDKIHSINRLKTFHHRLHFRRFRVHSKWNTFFYGLHSSNKSNNNKATVKRYND